MIDNTIHKIGEVLDDRFEVLKVLQGGMGQIFVCKNHSVANKELIVLKTFSADSDSDGYAALRDRFLKEAEAWIRIGRTDKDFDGFYLGLNETTIIDGRPYLIMNYCPGGNLRHRLESSPLVSPRPDPSCGF